MASRIKKMAFQMGKWLGIFQLSRRATRKQLRILCYHGTALEDEARFRPQLFIRPETFERRLEYLKKEGFQVLSLEEALERLRAGTLPDDSTVITIDDGFFSTYQSAVPALRKHRFPATLYVTSYYSEKGTPIFRLAVQYLFWATSEKTLDLTDLGLPFEAQLPLDPPEEKDRRMWQIIEWAETHFSEAQRQELAERLAVRLGVDFERLKRARLLSLARPEEIVELARAGVDIQLHTHRHRFPEEAAEARREIDQNRASLEPLVGKFLKHLCYPSGLWSRKQWPWLSVQKIASATTCEPGFVDASTPNYALSRFLDGENISQIEFEAELNGLSELLRRARAGLKQLRERGLGDKRVLPHVAHGP